MNGLTDCREEQDYNYLERDDRYIPEEIEVTISITMNKTFTIPTEDLEVFDYVKGYKDFAPKIIFTEGSMEDYVKNNLALPDQAFQYVPDRTNIEKEIKENLKDWNVDEFVVTQEEYC
jgi:hypothetical protein